VSASFEAKWLKQSGLVLLLPHGYDGAGPEHSNARMERFLQLCDSDSLNNKNPRNLNPNLQVVNVTTPANYFHLLRRQIKRNFRKPLIVIAPKILLRHPMAVSKLEEMSVGTGFRSVIADEEVNSNAVERIFLCTGKFYVDLVQERRKRASFKDNTAIIRLEELSPFPAFELETTLGKYKNAKELYWVQEESQNAGGWLYIQPRVSQFQKQPPLKYLGRPPCPASAIGIGELHKKELSNLLDACFPSK